LTFAQLITSRLEMATGWHELFVSQSSMRPMLQNEDIVVSTPDSLTACLVSLQWSL